MAVVWLTTTSPPHGLTEPWETPHSASESWTNDKLSATVQLRCVWSQRHAIMANLLTYGKAWPYHTGSGLRATHGTVASDGGQQNVADGSGNSFEHGILTVNFDTAEATTPDGEGDTVIYSEAIEPTAEFLTLPHDKVRWTNNTSGDPIKAEEAPGMLQVGLDYKITYYNLSTIPAAFLTLVGSSNSAAVPSGFFGSSFAIETLLYNPPVISRSVSIGGANKFTLTTRLTFKPQTWNKFWRVKTGAYEFMYHENSASPIKPYAPSSFAGILPNGIL